MGNTIYPVNTNHEGVWGFISEKDVYDYPVFKPFYNRSYDSESLIDE